MCKHSQGFSNMTHIDSVCISFTKHCSRCSDCLHVHKMFILLEKTYLLRKPHDQFDKVVFVFLNVFLSLTFFFLACRWKADPNTMAESECLSLLVVLWRQSINITIHLQVCVWNLQWVSRIYYLRPLWVAALIDFV